MGAKDLATRTDLLDGFMEIADLSECGGSESYSLLSTRLREIRKVVARVLGLRADVSGNLVESFPDTRTYGGQR